MKFKNEEVKSLYSQCVKQHMENDINFYGLSLNKAEEKFYNKFVSKGTLKHDDNWIENYAKNVIECNNYTLN